MRLFEENETEMANALALDLRKHKQEAVLTEIAFLQNEISSYIHNLKDWTKPETVRLSNIYILQKFI